MRALLAAWSLCIAFGAEAQVLGHTLRETVETWSEPARSRTLSWLDACRAAADDYSKLWLQGDDTALYSATSRRFRAGNPPADFTAARRVMQQAFGDATALEHRSTSLLSTAAKAPQMSPGRDVQVVYAARTNKPSAHEVFFEVYLEDDGGLCRVGGVRYQFYFTDVPWWLRGARPASPRPDITPS